MCLHAMEMNRCRVGALCLAMLLGMANEACEGSTAKTGGGVLVYAASDLAIVRLRLSGCTLAAMVPGLSTVEMIDSETGTATPIDPPPGPESCVRFPVAMAAGDLDGDGEAEIAVMDPSCGNWIATAAADGSFRGRPWTDLAPEVLANPYLTIGDFDGDGVTDIATGHQTALTVLTRPSGTWSEATWWFPPSRVGWVSRLFAVVSPGRLLFQRGGIFSLVDIAVGQQAQPVEVSQVLQTSRWLEPFVGFDHLSVFGFSACPQSLLGIGVAAPEAGAVPREAQLLSYDGASTNTVTDSGLGAEHVQSLSLVRREDKGDYLVGLIDGEEQAPTRFVLARIEGCGSLHAIASAEVEFDWRTPDAPPEYSEPTLPKRGVVLAGTATSTGAVFLHYDGFSLRIFTANEMSGAWTLAARRFDIHQTREDHTW